MMFDVPQITGISSKSHCRAFEIIRLIDPVSGVEYESDGKLPKSKSCFTGVDVTSGIDILSEEGTDDNEVMDGSSWLKDSSDKCQT